MKTKSKTVLLLLTGEQELSNSSLSKASFKYLSKSNPRDPLVEILQSYAEAKTANNHEEKNILLHKMMIHLAKNHEQQSDLLNNAVNQIMVNAKKSDKTNFIRDIQTDLAAYKVSAGINQPAPTAAATAASAANEPQHPNRSESDPYRKRAQKYDTKAMRNQSKGTNYSTEALRPNKSSSEDAKKEKPNIFRRMFK